MSSVSGVSSLLNQYEQVNLQNNSSQMKQDFSDLMTSLQSGKLAEAQTASLSFDSKHICTQPGTNNPAERRHRHPSRFCCFGASASIWRYGFGKDRLCKAATGSSRGTRSSPPSSSSDARNGKSKHTHHNGSVSKHQQPQF